MLGRDYPRTTHQGWPVITIANTAGASNNNNLFFYFFFWHGQRSLCISFSSLASHAVHWLFLVLSKRLD